MNALELLREHADYLRAKAEELDSSEQAWLVATDFILAQHDQNFAPHQLALTIYRDIGTGGRGDWCDRVAVEVVRHLYAETKWGQAILAAAEIGVFSEQDKEAAKSWRQCAVGLLDPRLPRDKVGRPLDRTLQELGETFSRQVRYDEIGLAANFFVSIQLYASDLLDNLNQESE